LNTNISVTVPKNEQNTFITEQPQKTNFIKIENDFSFERIKNFENKNFSMIQNIQNMCEA
jgi:hypothetical protein